MIQRMQSPLGDVFDILFVISFCSPSPRSSFCKAVLVSVSRCEVRVFDSLLEMSLGHQLLSASVVFLVAECSLSSVDLKQIF